MNVRGVCVVDVTKAESNEGVKPKEPPTEIRGKKAETPVRP